ncbi:hypothetical protein TURU_021642 [Turdus rufiventris]|nr:hypothetical protein TURU_021642 [Turdus rufiventris]
MMLRQLLSSLGDDDGGEDKRPGTKAKGKSLIYLLIVLVLLISPTLGDMGTQMIDFHSNVQGQLNGFEFSKLT